MMNNINTLIVLFIAWLVSQEPIFCPTWFELSDEQGEAMGIVKLEQQTQCILCIVIGMKKNNQRYSEILIIINETSSVTKITINSVQKNLNNERFSHWYQSKNTTVLTIVFNSDKHIELWYTVQRHFFFEVKLKYLT